jgi:hypothetical protein
MPLFYNEISKTQAYLSYYPSGTHTDLIWGALNCLAAQSMNETDWLYICRKEIVNPIDDYFDDLCRAQDDYDATYLLQWDHYWNPYRKKGLYGNIGAPYHAQSYFDKAVDYYLGQGIYTMNKHMAYYYLGYTIHLLQDATIPHHSNLDPYGYHTTYENFCDQEYKDGNILFALTGIYSSPRDWRGDINVMGWIHEAALTSAPYYDVIENSAFNYNAWLDTAKELMEKAVQLTAGMLLYFWQYVQNIDYDLDGLDAITEQENNADHTLTDSDFDTINDLEEITLGNDGYITKPGTNDTDSDFLTDPQEIDVYLTNPTLNDTDTDSFLDGDEVAKGYDPLDPNDHPPYPTNPTPSNTPTLISGVKLIIPLFSLTLIISLIIIHKKRKN